MTMNRHESFEELISASLTEDLTETERQRLDAHLASCAQCTTTLAAYADQRRIMAGVRHVGPPRDLGARVRTGIERGRFATLPWWRRPATIFAGVGGSLAAVTGALLAVVLLNGSSDEPQLGDASPTPTVSTASAAPTAQEPSDPLTTLPPLQSSEPSAAPSAGPASAAPASAAPSPSVASSPSVAPSPSVGPSASAAPAPTATPAEASPEPDVYLALTGPFDNLGLTLRHGATGETITELDTPSGPPIAAELSPNGQWLAYITQLGSSGMNEMRVSRIADSSGGESPIGVYETVVLGESLAGSPFLEQMSWSSESRYLAFTLAKPDGGETDVWVFDTENGEPRQLSDVGHAYAGDWIPDEDGVTSRLWVSLAQENPVSYVLALRDDAPLGPADPADIGTNTADGVFQPLLSSSGGLAIFWQGRMARVGDDWLFSEGGAPYLAEHDIRGGTFEFSNERPLFSNLSLDGDAFTSAAISWGTDDDAYAVWAARWTAGSPDGDTPYPDVTRVYFGHATDPRGLTQGHAIDSGDLPEGAGVVNVKVSPTGRHLAITALRPIGGVQEAPRADLFLIERNTGNVADEVFTLGSADDGWFGPAAFDELP